MPAIVGSEVSKQIGAFEIPLSSDRTTSSTSSSRMLREILVSRDLCFARKFIFPNLHLIVFISCSSSVSPVSDREAMDGDRSFGVSPRTLRWWHVAHESVTYTQEIITRAYNSSVFFWLMTVGR